jgi:outer membrane protein assembly factor BamB
MCLFAPLLLGSSTAQADAFSLAFRQAVERNALRHDICVVLELPPQAQLHQNLAGLIRDRDLMVYFQSGDRGEVRRVRAAAETQGLLGSHVFVGEGPVSSIHLADNLAGLVIVSNPAAAPIHTSELKRVIYPGGTILVGDEKITKPAPTTTDWWSHPYHGPDNNPQSLDQEARAPYLTQFLADPKFVPMPEISVAAGGRVFRAFGHIAHKANQNAMLNTLICVNAYNGRIRWQRALKEGFMIHRNTLIATPEILYMADDEACHLIDAETGDTRGRIVIPAGMADGPVWKWMALEDGVLYALVGGTEAPIKTQPSRQQGLGHWPWGMWDGHDYGDPRTNFGFGRTFVAIDPASGDILWSVQSEEYLDSRGVCMKNGRIYSYGPEKVLTCLDTQRREFVWRNSDPDLLAAIGTNKSAQHYVTGYATTTYIKCNDDYLFFAGPQRDRLVVASAADGRLLWQREEGNLQLVLREDGFYAAGPQPTPAQPTGPNQIGVKYDYATGKVLARLPQRRACTRATGSIDSIFFRTPGGTVRVNTNSHQAQHIAPMRPACQDGVIISDGHLFWGPWMCGCQLSLYGHIALAPAGDFDFYTSTGDPPLEVGPGDDVMEPAGGEQGDDGPNPAGEASIPVQVQSLWETKTTDTLPTAVVADGEKIYQADRKGCVQAFDKDGQRVWKAYTGAAVYYAPAIEGGRLFVGSADGWVYALAARTGERLWRFRVGPASRRIPVYGKLISTWPVAGGVAVRDGVVYAAGGISHYDGTYVVGLNAETGRLRWMNNRSGMLSEAAQSGISLQGPLSIQGRELHFAGGGRHRVARFDLATGRCLNEPHQGLNSRHATAFYPYFTEYAKHQPLHHPYPDGRLLQYQMSYEGSQFDRLKLLGPAPAATAQPNRPRDGRPQGPQRPMLWQHPTAQQYQAFVVTPKTLLAAGRKTSRDDADAFLRAVRIADGAILWEKTLPALTVKNGLTLDRQGRILVSLENGTVVCYGDVKTAALIK